MKTFVAYRLQEPNLCLAPGDERRRWMHGAEGRIAYRCLPLLIANQSGWVISQRGRVTAEWNGGPRSTDCSIESTDCLEPPLSHFGDGIVTWRIPYLFRTPPGWNLLMRGPANEPKDGASSLEGVIETDWAVQPAFHSWKMTRPDKGVTWEDGEPICMILPQRRGELEDWRPRSEDIANNPDLLEEYSTFSESRFRFNAQANRRDWQKHYFVGASPGKARAGQGQHQTRLKLFDIQVTEPRRRPSNKTATLNGG